MKSYQIMRLGAYAVKYLVPCIVGFLLAVAICYFVYYLYKKGKEKKEKEYEE